MLLEHVEANCLTQTMREPTSKDSPQDLLCVIREGLVGDAMTGVCFGQSKLEIIIFNFLRSKQARGSAELLSWTFKEMMSC